jgi:nicotinamidase-related amidase
MLKMKLSKKTIRMIIVDAQIGFAEEKTQSGQKCELSCPEGKLKCKNISQLIGRLGEELEMISVTQDSHNLGHIGLGYSWYDSSKSDLVHPPAFTEVVEYGKPWARLYEEKTSREYVEKLGSKRMKLTIWPPHCLKGTEQELLQEDVQKSLTEWEEVSSKSCNLLKKGMSNNLEEYSPFCAYGQDRESRFNFTFANEVIGEDLEPSYLLVTGFALSHCVAATVRDLVWFRQFKGLDEALELIVLTDCTSVVNGCQELADDLIAEVEPLGVKFLTSAQFLDLVKDQLVVEEEKEVIELEKEVIELEEEKEVIDLTED